MRERRNYKHIDRKVTATLSFFGRNFHFFLFICFCIGTFFFLFVLHGALSETESKDNRELPKDIQSKQSFFSSFLPSPQPFNGQRNYRVDSQASRFSDKEHNGKQFDIIIGIISGSNRIQHIVGCILTWIFFFESDRDRIIIFTDENVVERVSSTIQKYLDNHEVLLNVNDYEKLKNFKNYVEFVTLFKTDSSWRGSQKKPKLAIYYITKTYFLDTEERNIDSTKKLTNEERLWRSEIEQLDIRDIKSFGKWAFLVDDDTFVIPKNLRKLLLNSESVYDYRENFYIGRSMTCEFTQKNGVKKIYQFAHGGSGYALSYGLLNQIYPELEKQIQENYFPETRATVKPSQTSFSDCEIGAWLKDYFDILPFHENCFHAQGPEKYREYFALNKRNKERLKDVNIDEAKEEDYFANLKNPCTFHYAFSKDASQRFNIFSWNLQYNS